MDTVYPIRVLLDVLVNKSNLPSILCKSKATVVTSYQFCEQKRLFRPLISKFYENGSPIILKRFLNRTGRLGKPLGTIGTHVKVIFQSNTKFVRDH